MKDIIVFLNGAPVYRTLASDIQVARAEFVEQFGPWDEREGYSLYFEAQGE